MKSLSNLKQYILESQFAESISNISIVNYGKEEELFLTCDTEKICSFLTFLRDDKKSQFKMLIGICGIDYPERQKRFEVVYHLLSLKYNLRVIVKISASEDDQVPTITEIFNAATWYEREVFDLYGIVFKDHNNLRRILTDYHFEGHPLRKDFPLTGHKEVIYDADKNSVVERNVTLTQEFRNFDFKSPWKGEDYLLPGDEKATK